MITDALVRKATGQYDPDIIQRLSLQRLSLKSMMNLDRCTCLIELSLAWNEITEINGLSHMTCLKKLDLSHNKIRKIGNV